LTTAGLGSTLKLTMECVWPPEQLLPPWPSGKTALLRAMAVSKVADLGLPAEPVHETTLRTCITVARPLTGAPPVWASRSVTVDVIVYWRPSCDTTFGAV
jgi:hypothetical protein